MKLKRKLSLLSKCYSEHLLFENQSRSGYLPVWDIEATKKIVKTKTIPLPNSLEPSQDTSSPLKLIR